MNLYNLCAKNIFLPASDLLLGTEAAKTLSLFERSQWWSSKDLEDYQNRRLKTLITYAYENVPYYHKLFKSLNLKPIDFKSKKDLSKLPVLSKTDIINNPGEFFVKNINKHKLIKASTSGSTGKPFEFYMDKMTLSASRAVGLRAWGFSGYRLGDKTCYNCGICSLAAKYESIEKNDIQSEPKFAIIFV